MLNVFVLNNRRLNQLQVDSLDDLKNSEPIWIDMVAPTETEREWVKSLYDFELPSPENMQDLEASARFFEGESGELHLRSDFLLELNEDDSRNVPVAFVLKNNTLLSNLFVRMLQQVGIEAERFGSSTGKLSEV